MPACTLMIPHVHTIGEHPRGHETASGNPLSGDKKNLNSVTYKGKGGTKKFLVVRRNQACTNGQANEARHISDVQAVHQVRPVGLHGLDTDVEPLGDLAR